MAEYYNDYRGVNYNDSQRDKKKMRRWILLLLLLLCVLSICLYLLFRGSKSVEVLPDEEVVCDVQEELPDEVVLESNERVVPLEYIPIYTAEDMNSVRTYLEGKYMLMNDISLDEYDNWVSIEGFTGIFEGDGKSISGLAINTTGNNQGLFGSISGGEITNLTIREPNIRGWSSVGAVCGNLSSSGKITNCAVLGGLVSGGGGRVGGVVGFAWVSTSVTSCHNTSMVSAGGGSVGGVIGRADSPVARCYNMGSISGGGSSVGGIVGDADAAVTSCYNMGSVKGSSWVGGVVGYTYSSITSCYNTGSVSGRSGSVGGIVGYASSSSITSCYYIDRSGDDADSGVGYNYRSRGDATAVTIPELNGRVREMNTSASRLLDDPGMIYYVAGDPADSSLPLLKELEYKKRWSH